MLANDIKMLLRIGANIDISQSSGNYTLSDLTDFVRIVASVDSSSLTIASNKIAPLELNLLARIGREKLKIVIL